MIRHDFNNGIRRVPSMTEMKTKLKRREFLGLLGQAATIVSGITIIGSCKGGNPAGPNPPPPTPVRSNVLVRFFNHTQGYIGEKTYAGMSDQVMAIKVSDCPDISNVDPNRIAVRKAANGGWLGSLIEYSPHGVLNRAKYPTTDSEFDAFLMNNTNGVDYSLIDNNRGLYHSPNATWDREDHWATGPDGIPHEAVRQVKEALVFPWAKYMDFTELQPNVRGNIWVGYLYNNEAPYKTYRGSWSEGAAYVNPVVVVDDVMKLRVFIEMLIGHIVLKEGFAYNSVLPPAYEYLTDTNGITALGKDIVACSVVKDAYGQYAG